MIGEMEKALARMVGMVPNATRAQGVFICDHDRARLLRLACDAKGRPLWQEAPFKGFTPTLMGFAVYVRHTVGGLIFGDFPIPFEADPDPDPRGGADPAQVDLEDYLMGRAP